MKPSENLSDNDLRNLLEKLDTLAEEGLSKGMRKFRRKIKAVCRQRHIEGWDAVMKRLDEEEADWNRKMQEWNDNEGAMIQVERAMNLRQSSLDQLIILVEGIYMETDALNKEEGRLESAFLAANLMGDDAAMEAIVNRVQALEEARKSLQDRVMLIVGALKNLENQ